MTTPRQRNRPAWAGSDRKARLPGDWMKRRLAALERCFFICEWVENGVRCPERATDVDHTIANDDDSDENLQGLCRRHHLAKTSKEANAVRWGRRAVLKRRPEANPLPPPGSITPPKHRGF